MTDEHPSPISEGEIERIARKVCARTCRVANQPYDCNCQCWHEHEPDVRVVLSALSQQYPRPRSEGHAVRPPTKSNASAWGVNVGMHVVYFDKERFATAANGHPWGLTEGDLFFHPDAFTHYMRPSPPATSQEGADK